MIQHKWGAGLAVLAAGALIIAGCASRGPDQISDQAPTVSYAYDRGEAEEAAQDAAKYCDENYGRTARVVNDAKSGDGGTLTFECVNTSQ